MFASGVKASGGFKSLCKAQQNAAVTAQPSTWTKSPFESVDFDGLGEVDYTTDKRWNAAADGIYRINAIGSIKSIPSTAGVGCVIRIYKNGSGLMSGGWPERSPAGSRISNLTQETPVMVATVIELNAGDYIEVYMYHNHSAPLLIEGPNFCIIQRIK